MAVLDGRVGKAGHVQILRGGILFLGETPFLRAWILSPRQIENSCDAAVRPF